jgi:3-oxoacyl-[acyl-carrier protein] reductase
MLNRTGENYMSKLENKVAVVTGASKGIGAGIAKAFAAVGATVIVNHSSGKEDANKVVDEIVAAGGKAVAIGANLARESEIAGLFSETKRLCGHVDILVNNAGVVSFAPLEGITGGRVSPDMCSATSWRPRLPCHCFLRRAAAS